MKRCINCVLPETFPGISFNEKGVCSFCQHDKGNAYLKKQKEKYRTKFNQLVERYQNRSQYDCLMAYSGGKDSTYTLYILKNEFNLNILALTCDNGFISPYALKNIKNVSESLGIDHILFKPRFDILKKIFRTGAEKEIFPAKILERASTICTSCMGLVKFLTLRIAIEKKIPIIAYGWSPGQAPLSASVFKNNPAMLRKMQRAIKGPLQEIVGDAVKHYFLDEKNFENGTDFPYNVSPLAFSAYNENEIYETINKLGWQMPVDTDSNSTNCLLNSYANVIHKIKFNFHPYAFEIAKLVREGYMDRIEAISKLNTEEDSKTLALVEKKLFAKI